MKSVTPSVIRPLDHPVYPTAEPLSHESFSPSGLEKHAFYSLVALNAASPGHPRRREAEHQRRRSGGGRPGGGEGRWQDPGWPQDHLCSRLQGENGSLSQYLWGQSCLVWTKLCLWLFFNIFRSPKHHSGGQLLSDRWVRASDSNPWLLQRQPSRDQEHRFFLNQLCWR